MSLPHPLLDLMDSAGTPSFPIPLCSFKILALLKTFAFCFGDKVFKKALFLA